MKTSALTLALLLFLAAPTAAQDCPDLPLECSRWAPECPYPSAQVSVSQQREMLAMRGPWCSSRTPPGGMQECYPSVEDWRRAAWGRDAGEMIDAHYCRPGPCGVAFSAWYSVQRALKPMSNPQQVCGSHTGDHGFAQARYKELFGEPTTLGRWLEVECNEQRGGRWVVDSGLESAVTCRSLVESPYVFPESPTLTESGWIGALALHERLGLAVRDQDGHPITTKDITCHFRQDSTDCTGVTPPPPEPPGCTPYDGSACASACTAKELAQDACFALADRFPNSLLAKRCNGVCRDGEEPPPPEPPTGKCYRWEPSEATIERAEFVPGVESTGLIEVKVLVRGEWVEVDCKAAGL